MPVNVIDSHFHSFIKNVFPPVLDGGLGILAMKSLSDGRFFGEKRVLDSIEWKSEDPLVPNYISVKEALYFVWSLPVSVLITGAENKELIAEKTELAKSFIKISENERHELMNKVLEKAGNLIEYYKKV
ncbi:MAG: hypothetical protein IPJ37_16215 [Bacteroidales bacterium]|nr:hypothetical protein [Bacteroidales bacterium]